jgi:hypothetical protein
MERDAIMRIVNWLEDITTLRRWNDLDYAKNEMRYKQNDSREHKNTVKPNFH